MRLWIGYIKMKSVREYPTMFLFEGTTAEGNDAERRIRRLYEQGAIKDFSFHPIKGPTTYEPMHYLLLDLEGHVKPRSRR